MCFFPLDKDQQEIRPGTRLVSGQSSSPHHEVEVESIWGSDRFDEFEGRLFECEEYHFSTPLLFVENDERDARSRTENEKLSKNEAKTRTYKKKRRRRKRELAKIKRKEFPLSESENDEIVKTEKQKRTQNARARKSTNSKFQNKTVNSNDTYDVSFNVIENEKHKHKKQDGVDDISSSHAPTDTVFSVSSGEEWKIESTEHEQEPCDETAIRTGQQSCEETQSLQSGTAVSSQYSRTSSQDSSYFGSDYAYSPSPPPTRRKVCWPIDGRLRHLPPIRKKVEEMRQSKGKSYDCNITTDFSFDVDKYSFASLIAAFDFFELSK